VVVGLVVVVVEVVVVIVVVVAVDTCSHGNGGCQHRCTDQSEGPACACHEKYVLRDDLHTCQGKGIAFGDVKRYQAQGRHLGVYGPPKVYDFVFSL